MTPPYTGGKGPTWNRAARRSGGSRPVRFPVTAGILVGARCRDCGAEKIAVAPIVHARCLQCGAIYGPGPKRNTR
jgi:uncharacterized OB-fold protein